MSLKNTFGVQKIHLYREISMKHPLDYQVLVRSIRCPGSIDRDVAVVPYGYDLYYAIVLKGDKPTSADMVKVSVQIDNEGCV